MEECVNNRLNKLFIPNISSFMIEFRRAQADIIELKNQPPQSIFNLAVAINDED